MPQKGWLCINWFSSSWGQKEKKEVFETMLAQYLKSVEPDGCGTHWGTFTFCLLYVMASDCSSQSQMCLALNLFLSSFLTSHPLYFFWKGLCNCLFHIVIRIKSLMMCFQMTTSLFSKSIKMFPIFPEPTFKRITYNGLIHILKIIKMRASYYKLVLWCVWFHL